MSSDPTRYERLHRNSEQSLDLVIIPSKSNDAEPPPRIETFRIPKPPPLPVKVCYTHPQENLISVCTMSRCPNRGAICPQCQVREHADHLDKTWNLSNFLQQIERQVGQFQPGTFSLNEFLVQFLDELRTQKDQMIMLVASISQLVKEMTEKAKVSYDRDIDDTKYILKNLENVKHNDDFTPKISRLTQYFGIDPETRKVFRKNSYGELYKWKINELLLQQKDFFNTKIQQALSNLQEIASTFGQFRIPEIDIVDIPRFQAMNNIVPAFLKIEKAHQNWIRSVQMFHLSDLEVFNLKIENLAQMAQGDPLTEQEGLFAIVTNSDDMEVKIWVYSPEDKLFHNLSSVSQAHFRECLSMRVQYFETETLQRMGDGEIMCNNLILTAEHGLIKIWDWIQHKCINEIKTYSLYTYDFEVLRFPELGLCYAKGSKNIIQVTDMTSPGGMFIIKEINPEEQHEEITCFEKIRGQKTDLLVASFGGTSGVIKVYHSSGKCLHKFNRQQKELAFCLTTFSLQQDRDLKKGEREKLHDVVVVGSDMGSVTAFDLLDGRTLWNNQTLHNGWVRGLTSIIVKDSFAFKRLVLSTSENEYSLKIIDGRTGILLHTINEAFDSGLRFRSLTCLQGKLDPRIPESTVIAAGTKKGTIFVFKIQDSN